MNPILILHGYVFRFARGLQFKNHDFLFLLNIFRMATYVTGRCKCPKIYVNVVTFASYVNSITIVNTRKHIK